MFLDVHTFEVMVLDFKVSSEFDRTPCSVIQQADEIMNVVAECEYACQKQFLPPFRTKAMNSGAQPKRRANPRPSDANFKRENKWRSPQYRRDWREEGGEEAVMAKHASSSVKMEEKEEEEEAEKEWWQEFVQDQVNATARAHTQRCRPLHAHTHAHSRTMLTRTCIHAAVSTASAHVGGALPPCTHQDDSEPAMPEEVREVPWDLKGPLAVQPNVTNSAVNGFHLQQKWRANSQRWANPGGKLADRYKVWAYWQKEQFFHPKRDDGNQGSLFPTPSCIAAVLTAFFTCAFFVVTIHPCDIGGVDRFFVW